jgi:GAF domain-containing protein
MNTNTSTKKTIKGCAKIIKELLEANIQGTAPVEKIKNKIQDVCRNYNLKDISDVFLEESLRLIRSENCYLAFVDPENGDSVGISFSHLTDSCQAYEDMGEARFKMRKDGTYGGLLGYSLDTGKSFYVHDISSHPAAHGLPPGHEPVNQFLSVPVVYDGKITGQIVFANPHEDYGPENVATADKIAEIYGMVLDNLLY